MTAGRSRGASGVGTGSGRLVPAGCGIPRPKGCCRAPVGGDMTEEGHAVDAELVGSRAGAPGAYRAANHALWEEWAAINYRSANYDVAGFKAGGSRLRPYEVEEVGDVAGKDLLHLQCHFGLDTLSWARLGARVTGVDFSEPAIQYAVAL